jgi:glycine oxidase
MSDADVIVVGAGIIGCAVGRELARRGAKVRIIEARTVAAGATQASAGVLAPYIEAHDRGALLDLAVRSLALYDEFVAQAVQESGIAVEYRRCGSLELATDEPTADTLRRTAERARDVGLQWLSPEDVRRLEPALQDSIRGALVAPMHAYVAVTALTEALAWAALKHGAELETGRRIASLSREGDHLAVTSEDGSKWLARTVVLAAGSWSGQVDPAERAALDVRPVRGQLLRLSWSAQPISHILWGPDCYVVPWRDGTVLVGATVEEVGYDERTTAAGVRDLLDAVCELLPEAWRATFVDARAGLRPATSDGLPIIGRSTKTEGLIYATGHYRNGVLLAPLTAAVVGDLILEGEEDPILATTPPGRIR